MTGFQRMSVFRFTGRSLRAIPVLHPLADWVVTVVLIFGSALQSSGRANSSEWTKLPSLQTLSKFGTLKCIPK